LDELDRPLVEIEESVNRFTGLDALCERIKEKGICDALGVQCNSSCRIYIQKEELLKALEGFIKARSAAAVDQTVAIIAEDQPKAKEKSCPSCGQKPAREEAKYCDYCGEEL